MSTTATSGPFPKGIETTAIVKAIHFLRAAKCDFFIYKNGQVVIDTFPKRVDPASPPPRIRQRVAAETTAPTPKKGGAHRLNDFVTLTDYVALIEGMTPAKPVTIVRQNYPAFKNKHTWVSFQASFQNKANRQWGSDNVVIDRNGNESISALRIDPQDPFAMFEKKGVRRAAKATPVPVPLVVKVRMSPAKKAVLNAAKTAAKKAAAKKAAKKADALKSGGPLGATSKLVQALATGAKVVTPTATTPKKLRRRLRRSFMDTGYPQKLKSMKPGDTVEFNRKDYDSIRTSNAAWVSFASAVMGRSRAMHGADKVVHEFKAGGGILRILLVK